MKLPKALVFVGELAVDLFQEWRASRAQRNAALAAKRAEQSRRYQQASNAARSVSRYCVACEMSARGLQPNRQPPHTCGKGLH